MTSEQLQEECERGQQELVRTNYLQAERILEQAERVAWELRDFDTLARLYMPLQEARRQRRLRCGEGVVCLDLVAQGPNDRLDGRHVVENFPLGQLLVAGWGTIESAVTVRELQKKHELYVETFLGAVFPTPQGRMVAIVPGKGTALPSAEERSLEQLQGMLPPHCLLLKMEELPSGSRRGTTESFARVMEIWERLHLPFLHKADSEEDPVRKIVGYRRTIEVDYACELAHQKLSDVARELGRAARLERAGT